MWLRSRTYRLRPGHHGVVGVEPVDGAILKAERDHTPALAILHQEVDGEVLDEEVAVVAEALAVQGVEEGVAGPVSDTAAPVSLASLAVLVGLPTEGPLVDLALRGPAEGHAIVLQLDDSSWCLSGHVVDGILVSEPVRALDGVIHVPSPVVRLHVAKGRVDASLGGDSVAAGGEELGNDGGLESLLNKTESCSEAGTSSSNDDGIVLMVDDWVLS